MTLHETFRTDLFAHYPDSLLQRFRAFHEANPSVYKEFRSLAFQMRGTGRKTYGARSIFEVLRWHRNLSTKGDVFILNNDFTSVYVRLLISDYPEMRSFFELRVQTHEDRKSSEQRAREGQGEFF